MIGVRILPMMLAGFVGFGGAATAEPRTFKDCSDCPTMVKVPAGTFVMGSSAAETTRETEDPEYFADEHPPHPVTIAREFALGQFAVTRGEFAAFVRDTGYDASGCFVFRGAPGLRELAVDLDLGWRNSGFEQSDRHPVVCVSYDDAQRYVQWLSRKTDKSYRLPTEAEWEYAARAGTTTVRFWGDGRDRACDFANVADLTVAEALKWKEYKNQVQVFQCRDGYVYTAPVGSFRPNAFGLYDMLGNVEQWTEDCYHQSYSGAPHDAAAWVGGACDQRVLRGGYWASGPGWLRSAERDKQIPSYRDNKRGFRVGRTLTP
jgi:sulfatase modifying factor 1